MTMRMAKLFARFELTCSGFGAPLLLTLVAAACPRKALSFAALNDLRTCVRTCLCVLAGPILSFSQNLSNLSPTGFTSAPGIGYILACVAAALVMMMVIMTSRAGRRLLAAEAILAAGMMAGGVATVATLPGAGGFVTVAGGVMPGMGLGAPGGAVAVTMPGASSDGYYPTNPGAGYPGGGYPGGGYPAGAQAVPLPPAGGYAPPTEYGKSMY